MDLADANGDKKWNIKDIKIWFWIALQSLIASMILVAFINRNEIILAMQEGYFFTESFLSSLAITIVRFAWKGGKQTKENKNKSLSSKVESRDIEIERLNSIIKKSDDMVRDIFTYFENQIIIRDFDLGGLQKSVDSKDHIARSLIKKYDCLTKILEGVRTVHDIQLIENELKIPIPPPDQSE